MPKSWKKFEEQVANLYASLGYNTTEDIQIYGKQVDVLASRHIVGAGLVRIAVECKFSENNKAENNKVKSEDVSNYLNWVASAINAGEIELAAIVSNVGFGRSARDRVKGTGLRLLTVSDLENSILAVQDVAVENVRRYKERRIFQSYVRIGGVAANGLEGDKSKHIDDVEAEILRHIAGELKTKLLVVLADFGAGKTTLVERVAFKMYERYLDDFGAPLPLIIPLKDYAKHPDIEMLILRAMRHELGRDLPIAEVWKFIEDGRIVPLLDGFDEMVAETSENVRIDQIDTLGRLFANDTPVVLTCRQTYFATSSEFRAGLSRFMSHFRIVETNPAIARNPVRTPEAVEAHSLRKFLGEQRVNNLALRDFAPSEIKTVSLEQFPPERIEEYLQNFDKQFTEITADGGGWEKVHQFLLSVYDLSDLMRRPILLEMIVDTVLHGAIDIDNEHLTIGPSTLYEVYTDSQFNRDWEKGASRQHMLTMEERREFAEAIAITMLQNSTLEIRYADVEQLLTREFESDSEFKTRFSNTPAESLVSDILICTFLTHTSDAGFRFVHKSFYEFFVASYLKRSLGSGNISTYLKQYLPKEITYFLGGFAVTEPNVREVLIRHLRNASETSELQKRNIATAILYSAPTHVRLRLHDQKIFDFDIKKTEFQKCSLIGLTLSNATVSQCTFQDQTKLGLNASNTELVECDLTESNGRMQLSGSFIKTTNVVGCDIDICCDDVLIQALSITSSTLTIEGSVVDDAKISDSRINVGKSGLTLVHSSIEQTTMDITKAEDCQFNNSKITTAGHVELLGSSFSNCQLDITSATTARSCSFEGCELSGSAAIKLISYTTFSKCTFAGVKLSKAAYEQLVHDEKAEDSAGSISSTFVGCRGLVLLPENTNINLRPKSGDKKLVFHGQGDLYFIHERDAGDREFIDLLEQSRLEATAKIIDLLEQYCGVSS